MLLAFLYSSAFLRVLEPQCHCFNSSRSLRFKRDKARSRLSATPEPAFRGDKPKHPIMDSGCTALMKAAYLGDTAKVRELAEDGADLDATDAYGWTAVRYAVRNKPLGNRNDDFNASKMNRT